MQIELDEATAGIPWELLDTDGSRREPWAIRAKLLRKLRLQGVPRARPRRRCRRVRAGDRRAGVSRLCHRRRAPGEAHGVFDCLSAAGALGSTRDQLMADDPNEAVPMRARS